MKYKKLILTVIIIGSALFVSGGLILKRADRTVPQIIKEGKKLTKAKDVDQYTENAFSMLKKHSSISDDIWQGYDLNDKIIIVGERDNDTDNIVRGWILNTKNKKRLTNSELKEIEFPSAGGYSQINFKNKNGIVLAINKNLISVFSLMDFNYIYEVAVHEMYHFYCDDMGKYEELGQPIGENSERCATFPKEATPRAYRKMIYDNIVFAYENPENLNLYLGKAKYWYEKWKTEYPEEYNQSAVIDIAEGKARYVEYLMCIDYNGISKEEKNNALKTVFIKDNQVFDSLDTEAYELGFVSGILLDEINTNWKEEISKTPQRPVEMLLKDIQVVKDNNSHYNKILKKANTQTKKSNREIEKKLKNITETENNNNIALLQLNNDFISGSFTTSEFVEYNQKIVLLDFSATFKSNSGTAQINELSSYMTEENENIYIMPLTMHYEIKNDRLIINEKNILADIKIKEIKDNERKIYIME